MIDEELIILDKKDYIILKIMIITWVIMVITTFLTIIRVL